MSAVRSILSPCLLVLGCLAIKQRARPMPEWPCKMACEPRCGNMQSSRTGVPCLPTIGFWPYRTTNAWSSTLGERVLKAAYPSPEATEEACHGIRLYGDSAWCLKAFQNDSSKLLGLSFGIEARDTWSEKMSNNFRMPTKLFDCFYSPAKSPPLAMIVPNGQGPCPSKEGACYATHYDVSRVCLGGKKEVVSGRNYTTLTEQLKGRGPLSTHVKMDVEGSEWTVLADLLKNEDDMRKIRTLDMEVHFGRWTAPEASWLTKMTPEERVTREVKILEGIASKFAVIGSNIETNTGGWRPDKDCAEQQCMQPVVHSKGGFSLQQFAISFINRAYLDGQ